MTTHSTTPAPRTAPASQRDRAAETAVAAVVCGVLGLFFVNIVLGPIALALGTVALRRHPRGNAGTAAAWAGIVLGAADLAVFAALIIGALHGGALMLRFGT